ncbi:MAG: TAXI family TRAP transporter solute-binding subunit [Candidatus Rokubacteria bacterium]|nr:TAXI family TRAP transporter solute-binding subunit [Candidatus Rokubacteria bacterium]MBI3108062.1 TAXI family TRAP transporter solute-binding subunit [Candidatus Rokubacteria bacterium]
MRTTEPWILSVLLALGLCGAAHVAPTQAQQKATVVFSAGPTGGTWTPMAAATSDVVKRKFPEVDVQVEPGAALVNMEKIRTDKADLGWSMTTVLADARTGAGSWKGKQTDKPLLVATYYPVAWQLAVPADSGIKSIADLRGKAVALPPRGNTSLSEGWELLLRVHGMKLEDLGTRSHGSISENVELIKNRQAVAMGWFTVVPASFALDLGSARPIRLLPVAEDKIAEMRTHNPGFVRHVIAKGMYAAQGMEAEVVTIQAPTILIASSKTPAEVVYKITRAIVEGREAFAHVAAVMKGVTGQQMAESFGLPRHPGAERYYREAGLLK